MKRTTPEHLRDFRLCMWAPMSGPPQPIIMLEDRHLRNSFNRARIHLLRAAGIAPWPDGGTKKFSEQGISVARARYKLLEAELERRAACRRSL